MVAKPEGNNVPGFHLTQPPEKEITLSILTRTTPKMDPLPPSSPVKISIVIKAYNEEPHIESAIRSALAAIKPFKGEVILADGLSSDRTVEIAQQFPIIIIQLTQPADRRCGAGPQLGYQVAKGEFIYILDGDMELNPVFLAAALEAMEKDEKLGGVAGLVEEESEASYQFRGRKIRGRESKPGAPRWLDMGGLYRDSAVRQVGYFSNRNLHSYEEMELGLRLTSTGWFLRRLPIHNVLHHGKSEGSWTLLHQRWCNRYLDGTGEILRSAWGKAYFNRVAHSQKHLFVGLTIWLALLAGLLLWSVTPWLLVTVLLSILGLIFMRSLRIGSLQDACFGQLVWQVTSLAMVRGFFSNRHDPLKPIAYRIVASGNIGVA